MLMPANTIRLGQVMPSSQRVKMIGGRGAPLSRADTRAPMPIMAMNSAAVRAATRLRCRGRPSMSRGGRQRDCVMLFQRVSSAANGGANGISVASCPSRVSAVPNMASVARLSRRSQSSMTTPRFAFPAIRCYLS